MIGSPQQISYIRCNLPSNSKNIPHAAFRLFSTSCRRIARHLADYQLHCKITRQFCNVIHKSLGPRLHSSLCGTTRITVTMVSPCQHGTDNGKTPAAWMNMGQGLYALPYVVGFSTPACSPAHP